MGAATAELIAASVKRAFCSNMVFAFGCRVSIFSDAQRVERKRLTGSGKTYESKRRSEGQLCTGKTCLPFSLSSDDRGKVPIKQLGDQQSFHSFGVTRIWCQELGQQAANHGGQLEQQHRDIPNKEEHSSFLITRPSNLGSDVLPIYRGHIGAGDHNKHGSSRHKRG